jgi:peptidoglycan-associated lipoprotein
MKAKILITAAAALVLTSCENCHDVDVSASAAPGTPCDFKKVGDRVHFGFDKSCLDSEAKKTIETQAGWLKTYPNAKATVTGKCDERGTREYNIALGQRRAKNAAKALKENGVEEGRITTMSYGKDRPEMPNAKSDAEHALNRVAITEVNG